MLVFSFIFTRAFDFFELHFILYYITRTTKEITNRLSTSVTSLALNVTNSYHTVDQDISLDVNKHEDSTLIYLPTDIDLFKKA